MITPIANPPAELPTDAGTHLLSCLAAVRQRFIDASIALTSRVGVLATRSGHDCRAYQNGTTLEMYLEIDVYGRTVCWWLDATWTDANWDITASVLENRADQEYQNQLLDMPGRSAATSEELAAELDAAAEGLLATIEQGDFLAPAV
jgi:hypothetical protein